jgi:2-C-methyl-D-erythritol 4-phosphate cytidylyltransferase
METTYAIIPAAGRGIRMGNDRPKQFLDLNGKPILVHTLETFSRAEFVEGILLVVPEPSLEETWDLLDSHFRLERVEGQIPDSRVGQSPWYRLTGSLKASGFPMSHAKLVRLVVGGAERQDSVYNGLQHLPGHCGWVMIHDGVRPFTTPDLIRRTWAAGRESGACIAALPSTDTVKRVLDGKVVETLPRDMIWLVQTPQVFRKDLILGAYEEARRQGWIGTDDASFVERSGFAVAVTLGERSNVKVTTPEDLEWGAAYLRKCSEELPGSMI